MTRATLNCAAYVPASWKREVFPDWPDFAVYTEPRFGGMVTVDYKARGFRLGMSRHGPMNSTKIFNGRGWRAQLELDAARYLNEALQR